MPIVDDGVHVCWLIVIVVDRDGLAFWAVTCDVLVSHESDLFARCFNSVCPVFAGILKGI